MKKTYKKETRQNLPLNLKYITRRGHCQTFSPWFNIVGGEWKGDFFKCSYSRCRWRNDDHFDRHAWV